MKKYEVLIALDISTTVVGIATFHIKTKELLNLEHINLTKANLSYKHKEELFNRLYLLVNHIDRTHSKYDIKHIAVEEALKGSVNPSTAQRLYGFNLLVRHALYMKYGIEPETLSIHAIRRALLPQYITSKDTFSIPKGIDVKRLVWLEVSKKEPSIEWYYKRNSKTEPRDVSFDMADAYAVGYAYLKLYTK